MEWTKPLRVSISIIFVTAILCGMERYCFITSKAHALPQFTRQYELKCSKCHLAPPTLNFIGRRFLQNGYRFFREERNTKTILDVMRLDRTVPLGAWLSSQPYERKNRTTRIRPFHDARLYIGGGIYKDVSAFTRWDFEEEKGYRFSSRLATLSYNPTDRLNTHISWTSATFHDINDTLHNSRQLTLKKNALISQPFGGADNNGTLASPRQGIHVSGWLTDNWFYTLGYSGNADNTVIGNLSTLSGRLAFEFLPVAGVDSCSIAVGAFGMHGRKNSHGREFNRIISDLQVDIPLIYSRTPGVIRLMSAYLWAEDDLKWGRSAHNYAWYAQTMFISMSKGSPEWAPTVRFDEYSKKDRQEVFRELTVNLTYYFVENFRAHVEHWRQIDVPTTSDKNSSVIVRLVYLY